MEFCVMNRVKEEWDEETDGQQKCGVHVKEEPAWTGELDSSLKSDVKEESGLLALYAGHKVEGDLVQLTNSAFAQPTCGPERRGRGGAGEEETDRQQECIVEVKVEFEEKIDGQQQHVVYIKEEPEVTESCLKCDVKEESGLLELYSGHKVERDLVLGPEGPQPPDCAFAQPTCAGPAAPGPAPAAPGPAPGPSPAPPAAGPASGSSPAPAPGTAPAAGRDRARRGRGRIKQKPAQEKPFSCEVCLKQFKQRNYLVAHKRTHTEERPYNCDECMKQFKQKNHLVAHIRTHTGERRYSCDVCTKQFARKSTLDIHRRTHTGERPYSCDVCTKQFTETNTLVRHRRTHTGERPYGCRACRKTFVHRNTLVLHQRSHGAGGPSSGGDTITPAQS